MKRLEGYQAKWRDGIIEFWNRNLGDTFPMQTRLWEQNLRPEFGFLPEGSWLQLADGEIVGIVLNKYIPLQLGGSDLSGVGWINTLLVDREYRSQGVGSELYQRTEKMFQGQGLQKIASGAELGHFFPGIPAEARELERFLLQRGFTGGNSVVDLTCTRENFVQPDHTLKPEVAKEVRIALAKEEDFSAAAEFFAKYFHNRWEHEFRWAWEHNLLEGSLVLLWVKGVVKGFARIYDVSAKMLGPNVYWGALLRQPYGGLGPIGVAGDERGKGLGMELLYRSLEMLWERGVAEICIDFTTLVEFYGKLGFKPWKEYLRYAKNLR